MHLVPALAVGKREAAHSARRLLPRPLLVRSVAFCQHPLEALPGSRPLKAALVRGQLDHGGRRPAAGAPRHARKVPVSNRECASTNKTHALERPPLHRAAKKCGVTLPDPLLAPARLRRGPDIPRAWKTAETHNNVAGNAQRPHTPGADATQFPRQLGLRDRRCAPAVAWTGIEHWGVVVRARPGHQGQSGSASGLRHHRGAGRARRSTSPHVTCRPTSSGHNVRGGVRVSLGG